MSIQPIPPRTDLTYAGVLADRATQNDQILAAALADLEGRASDLESRSGTSGYLVRNVNGAVPGENGRVDIGLPDLGQIDAMAQLLADFQAGEAITDVALAARGIYPAALSPTATWQANRDALQAACDAAYAARGGTVLVPPGRHQVQGVLQDSHVHITGPGATLIHPNGTGQDIIRARTRSTTGGGVVGSTTVSVASAAGIEVGSLIAIQAAGGLLDTQTTTLTAAITADQTTGITLASVSGFPTAGMLMCGMEAITYTGISGTTLTGVTRGALSTTRYARPAGFHIGLARRHYTEVRAINGLNLTINTPLKATVYGADIRIGALAPSISNLKFDGSLVSSGAPGERYPIRWDLVRDGRIRDVYVRNAEAALQLRDGATDCVVEGVHAHDCGVPDIKRGASLWMYQSCRRNTFRDIRVTGRAWYAFYIDDRTTVGEEWSGPCEDNLVDGFNIDIDRFNYNAAFVLAGSNRNIIRNGTIAGSYSGLSISNGRQHLLPGGADPDNTTLNEVASIKMRNMAVPWVVESPNNHLHDLTYDDVTGVPENIAESYIYASSAASGKAPTVPGPVVDPVPGGAAERIAGALDFGAGNLRIGVLSDSTANDTIDWVRVWWLLLGQVAPTSLRRTYQWYWDNTNLVWTANTVDAAGNGSGHLDLWNAALTWVRGSTYTQYQLDNMFAPATIGGPLDVLIVSNGHNNDTQGPSDFVAEMEAMVNRVRVLHPDVSLLVSSQNPQFGTSTAAAHMARQAAIRNWARAGGHDYVPAAERFLGRPDKGASWVGPDGINPTTTVNGVTTGSFGSVAWAKVAFDLVQAARVRTT